MLAAEREQVSAESAWLKGRTGDLARAVAALDLLHRAGARVIRMICIVAAPEGVALVERHHPQVDIYTPVVDRELNAHKYIVPGLGDFGDRLFKT